MTKGAALALIFSTSALYPASAAGPLRADVFQLASPDFSDDGLLVQANAGIGASRRGPWECGGENASPALSWTNAPATTKSFAVVMFDPDGAIGKGSIHWVAYGIPPTETGLARSAGSKPSDKFVGGANDRKLATYFGPCPEPGDLPHHYVIQVYALDLATSALPAGLTRGAFMQKIDGHALAEASIVGRY